MQINWHSAAVAAVIGFALIGLNAQQPQQVQPPAAAAEIRQELLRLPNYGVFDYIAFSIDNGVAAVAGFAVKAALKDDAERAARRPGVNQVINKIDVLPVSPADDDLRRRVYDSIYTSALMASYTPGSGLLWGHRHDAGAGFQSFDTWRFPGMEPAGDEPIHIIVKDGRVLLLGVVDSEDHRNLAALVAREAVGVPVENELTVDARATTRR